MRQKGFTLIELLVALAIGSLVIVGALGTIYQVFWSTARTNSQVVALTDVHYAALRLKKDLLMVQLGEGDFPTGGTTVITLTPGGLTATLGWTDYTTKFGPDDEPLPSQEYYSSYALSATGELTRTDENNTESIAGRNITSVEFTQDPDNVGDDRVINVVITATAGDMLPRSETLQFSVYLRGMGIQ